MNEETKLLHRLSIDLKRDIQDIKDNMSWSEFVSWGIYYREEVTLDTISYQLSKLTELFYRVNFDGEVTVYDFLPNSTKEQRDEALMTLKKKKIEQEIMEKLI